LRPRHAMPTPVSFHLLPNLSLRSAGALFWPPPTSSAQETCPKRRTFPKFPLRFRRFLLDLCRSLVHPAMASKALGSGFMADIGGLVARPPQNLGPPLQRRVEWFFVYTPPNDSLWLYVFVGLFERSTWETLPPQHLIHFQPFSHSAVLDFSTAGLHPRPIFVFLFSPSLILP